MELWRITQSVPPIDSIIMTFDPHQLTVWHFAALFTVLFWIYACRLLQLAYASVRWPTVEGTVTKSRVVESTRDSGAAVWQPEVQFQYEVAGKSYFGKTFSYKLNRGTTAGDSARIVSDYPEGRTVTVFYNPASLRRAVLENGAGRNNWIVFFITTFFAVGVTWAVFFQSKQIH